MVRSIFRTGWKWSLALCICLAAPASAQVSTSMVVGFVEDMQEARMPGAGLKLINTQTGTENNSQANEVGAFLFAGVLPGSYTLQIEREGFATVQVRGITLNVGETKNLLIRMKIGQAMESVLVDGTQMALSTTSDSVSTIINRHFMENASLDGRSLQQLILITPGIVGQSPQALEKNPGTEGDLSVNGQTTQANWYIVDGVSGNFGATYPLNPQQLPSSGLIASSTALGTTHSLASLDALEEFRVSSSAYAAEYGRTPGGQFALFTRSGTNQFHGSVYNYFRNSSLDANDWFANFLRTGKAASHQNNFGGTFGGPIRIPHLAEDGKNSFFFLSYEGVRAQDAIAPTLQYVPSVEVRSAAPAYMRALLNAFPQPTGAEIRNVQDGQLSGLAPFIKKSSLPSSLDATSLRLDSNLPAQTSIFLRYSYTPSYLKTRNLSSVSLSRIDSQLLTLGATTQFSTRGVNQFRLGYTRSDASLNSTLDSFGGASVADLNRALGLTGNYATTQATAYLQMDGVGEAKLQAGQSSNAVRQWDIADTFTFLVGPHLLKSGIDIRRIASPVHPSDLALEQNFFSRDVLQQGIASEMLVTRNLPAIPIFHSYSAYAQDDWKVFPRLVFSYGVRWESNLAPSEAHGNLPYTIPPDFIWSSPIKLVVPQRRPLWREPWPKYFVPRAGLSLEVNRKEGRETIFRFGSGVFYGSAQQVAAEAFRSLGFISTNYLQNVTLPVASSDYEISPQPDMAIDHSKIFWFRRNQLLPQFINWSFSLEQSLSKQQALIVSYVGVLGQEQLMPRNSATPTKSQGDVELFSYWDDFGSAYNSFQLKYQYQSHWGLNTLASYNYAESMDYGPTYQTATASGIYPLRTGDKYIGEALYTRTYADLDIRQNLQGSVSWEIPKRILPQHAKALAGWAIDSRFSARTGFPLTPERLQLTDQITGEKYRPNASWSGDKSMYVNGQEYPGGRKLNGGPGRNGVFPNTCLNAYICYSSIDRNIARGFGAFQINLALRKEFHLNDRLNLQFRAEAFNLTNHPNFGYIDTDTSHAQFGRAIKMLNQSSGTVSPLYEQGGPRSLQFALRMHF